jgi:adenosylmethionine-8-amino-7-oxononanoate aminotransferase
MLVTATSQEASVQSAGGSLADAAARHLWMHFARMGGRGPENPIPVITRGEGVYIWDDKGRRILDGLAGLFVVQAGHGRREIAEVAAKQAAELAYFPVWGYATPPAAELAERIAHLAPGDLNRVFFTSGGGEAIESAWKVAKQYFKLIGKPLKHKVISRSVAYHGTPHGAMAITGLPMMKQDFEPLTPGAFHVPTPTSIGTVNSPTIPKGSDGGRPTGSRRQFSLKARIQSPRSFWSRCRTPVVASLRRPVTSPVSARFATATMCSWCRTR